MKPDFPAFRRVLFICYAFPPVGGAGVQRSVKFVKYLQRYGWQPTVLTVKNPSVPVLDTDLIEDIPKDIEVVRSHSWEPGYRIKAGFASTGAKPSAIKRWLHRIIHQWLQPDLQVLWNGSAVSMACSLINEGGYSAIYVSAPPFSSFLIGCRLKKKFGLPLILDFRDEWSLSARYLENQNHRSRMLERQMAMFQTTILQADAVIATTDASADELRQCCERVKSSAFVRRIYNGFDPSDFEHLVHSPHTTDRYRLVYTGTLWRLTDIEPLVHAIEILNQNHPELAAKFELQIVGRRTMEQVDLLERIKATKVLLTILDYLPHQQSLQVANISDGLLLLLANQAGAERIVPAKLFEYFALRKQILAIVPVGEVSRILDGASNATSIPPHDIESVVNWLVKSIEKKFSPASTRILETESAGGWDDSRRLEWCTRPYLTSELAETLNRVIDQNRILKKNASDN